MKGVTRPVDHFDAEMVERLKGETRCGPQRPPLSDMIRDMAKGMGSLGHEALAFFIFIFIFF